MNGKKFQCFTSFFFIFAPGSVRSREILWFGFGTQTGYENLVFVGNSGAGKLWTFRRVDSLKKFDLVT
jgi:hypothetical protein